MVTDRKRILLAEDHVETRKIIGLVLAEEEFELMEASNGLETLLKAKQQKPDLLLLDLVMPSMNGIEVCRQLRADPETRWVRIVALTGNTSSIDRDLAMEAGVDAYITKPFSPTRLLSTIRKMLADSPNVG